MQLQQKVSWISSSSGVSFTLIYRREVDVESTAVAIGHRGQSIAEIRRPHPGEHMLYEWGQEIMAHGRRMEITAFDGLEVSE